MPIPNNMMVPFMEGGGGAPTRPGPAMSGLGGGRFSGGAPATGVPGAPAMSSMTQFPSSNTPMVGLGGGGLPPGPGGFNMSGMALGELGLGALGTIGGFMASRQREKAFNAASQQRGAEAAGFNADRQQGLAAFEKGLTGIGGEQQSTQLQALQGLAGLDQKFQDGEAQGGMDMQAALAQIMGQAPVGGAFNQATAGPAGAGVQ